MEACEKYHTLFSLSMPAKEGEPQAPLSSLGVGDIPKLDKDTLGTNFLYFDAQNYAERLFLLCHRGNIPIEVAKGGYAVHCKITRNNCNNCRGIPASVGCEYGYLKRTGLGPTEARVLAEVAKLDYIRDSIRLSSMITGSKPWDESTLAKTNSKELSEFRKKKVEEKIADPFKGFPNDVNYPNPHKIAEYAKFFRITSKIGLTNPLAMWDEERQAAALGQNGVLAKRCSVNDNLWNLYKKTPGLTLEGVLKRMKAQYYLSKYNLESDPQQRLLLLEKFKEV